MVVAGTSGEGEGGELSVAWRLEKGYEFRLSGFRGTEYRIVTKARAAAAARLL